MTNINPKCSDNVQNSNDENICCNDTIAFVCPGAKSSFLHIFCKKHYERYIDSLKQTTCPMCKQVPTLNPPSTILKCSNYCGKYIKYQQKTTKHYKKPAKPSALFVILAVILAVMILFGLIWISEYNQIKN